MSTMTKRTPPATRSTAEAKRGRPRSTKPLDKHVLLRLDAAEVVRLDAERERLYDEQGLRLDRSQLMRWIIRQYLDQVEKEGPNHE